VGAFVKKMAERPGLYILAGNGEVKGGKLSRIDKFKT